MHNYCVGLEELVNYN